MEFDEFVLAASTADLAEADAARQYADALEFRIDHSEQGLDALGADLPLPVLVTNRVDAEGGGAPPGPDRLERLTRAVSHPVVEAVDIELATLEAGNGGAVLEAAREHDVAVVVSTHDFQGTPSRETLRELLERADGYGDVAKLAVTATGPGDVLDLLAETWAATNAGKTVATMAMGEPGRHSRIVAPLYGSRIGYAPLSPERATAPGQYDLATFRRLYDGLRATEGPDSDR